MHPDFFADNMGNAGRACGDAAGQTDSTVFYFMQPYQLGVILLGAKLQGFSVVTTRK